MLLRLPSPLILACLTTILSLSAPVSAAPLPSFNTVVPALAAERQVLLTRPPPPHALRILDDEIIESAAEPLKQLAPGESTIFADFLLSEVAPSMVRGEAPVDNSAVASFRIPVRESIAVKGPAKRGGKSGGKRTQLQREAIRKAKQELLQRIITISTTNPSASLPSATRVGQISPFAELAEAIPTPPPTSIEGQATTEEIMVARAADFGLQDS